MTARIPDVSVVLAVRDGAADLGPSIESVLGQRDVALELIVVDDGSSDGTPELLAAAARDPRVRIVRQEPEGLTAALALGCARARAPLLARQDSGDLSHPDRLRAQVALINGDDSLALVSCSTACVGPGVEPLYVDTGGVPPRTPVDLRPDRGAAVELGPSSHGSTLFRRDRYLAAGGYRPEFALAQDWDLWYRLGERGRFASVGRTLYLRRLGLNSLSFAAHDLQSRFREAAREAARLRASGAAEAPALHNAVELSLRWQRQREARRRQAAVKGRYHLGALLGDLGDPRAQRYLAGAALRRPWLLRAWWRWITVVAAAPVRREPLGFTTPEARELVARSRGEAA